MAEIPDLRKPEAASQTPRLSLHYGAKDWSDDWPPSSHRILSERAVDGEPASSNLYRDGGLIVLYTGADQRILINHGLACVDIPGGDSVRAGGEGSHEANVGSPDSF